MRTQLDEVSAEPAAGIQDLQEGAAGAPEQMPGTGPTMAVNMASLQQSRQQGSRPGSSGMAATGAPEQMPGTGRVNHDQ
ncbi:hypothetical protein ACR6EC_22850 [Bacillus subtilis]|uniref:hypothetical protein n=1 Tax=Bacillus subtilis TaxID=1423 RepID=UPI003EBE3C07